MGQIVPGRLLLYKRHSVHPSLTEGRGFGDSHRSSANVDRRGKRGCCTPGKARTPGTEGETLELSWRLQPRPATSYGKNQRVWAPSDWCQLIPDIGRTPFLSVIKVFFFLTNLYLNTCTKDYLLYIVSVAHGSHLRRWAEEPLYLVQLRPLLRVVSHVDESLRTGLLWRRRRRMVMYTFGYPEQEIQEPKRKIRYAPQI